MPHYVRIHDLPEDFDWGNKGNGRRVQCPKCSQGVRMYVAALEAACTHCRCECEVLTAPPSANLLRGKSRLKPPDQALEAASASKDPEQVPEAS